MARIEADWPPAGAVRAVYTSDVGVYRVVALDFESGASYMMDLTNDDVYVLGVDPEGRNYRQMQGSGFVWLEPPRAGIDDYLDPHFPQVMLRALLRMPDALLRVEHTESEQLRLTFRLARGRRDFLVHELPAVEVERWGGAERIDRDVVVTTTPDLQVISLEAEGRPTQVFEPSSWSRPGFTVVGRCPPPFESLSLKECEWIGPGTAERFGKAAVERQTAEARIARRPRNPIPATVDGDGKPVAQNITPIGAQRAASLTATRAVLLAGATLAALGIFVWVRNRRR